jgi:hypothetical protein
VSQKVENIFNNIDLTAFKDNLLQAVKESGGTFTSVATVGKGANNVITWTKGAANYLLASIEHTAGSSWPWDSAGKTISITFSG